MYFCNMNTEIDAIRQYLEARKAVRNATNPKAFLRLGKLYAQGIGTKENHVLSNYFYEKALAMGCKEAESLIDHEYDTGQRSIVRDIVTAMENIEAVAPYKIERLKSRLEKERLKKNFGNLSHIRNHIPFFYPDYNQEQGYDDLLNHRDTIDADICYSLCTADNWSEVNIDVLESMLQQLYAPIIQDSKLMQSIVSSDNCYLISDEDGELRQCLVHLRSSYNSICKNFKVEKQEIAQIDDSAWYPYFKVSLIPLLRLQAFRCLLSIRDIDPHIHDFMNCLDSDEESLNVCEAVQDQDIQLFLISYVELNIDTDSILIAHQKLLRFYRNHHLRPLVQQLNAYIERMTDAGIEHQLPEYTEENLPKIELT